MGERQETLSESPTIGVDNAVNHTIAIEHSPEKESIVQKL
jgi:hypothetical protein